jgi:hypothetical protein
MNLFTFPARGPHKDATFPRVTLKLSCFWHRTMIRSTYLTCCACKVQRHSTMQGVGRSCWGLAGSGLACPPVASPARHVVIRSALFGAAPWDLQRHKQQEVQWTSVARARRHTTASQHANHRSCAAGPPYHHHHHHRHHHNRGSRWLRALVAPSRRWQTSDASSGKSILFFG